jgi:hypothetical protein
MYMSNGPNDEMQSFTVYFSADCEQYASAKYNCIYDNQRADTVRDAKIAGWKCMRQTFLHIKVVFLNSQCISH